MQLYNPTFTLTNSLIFDMFTVLDKKITLTKLPAITALFYR